VPHGGSHGGAAGFYGSVQNIGYVYCGSHGAHYIKSCGIHQQA
jgi:hypothetical protein